MAQGAKYDAIDMSKVPSPINDGSVGYGDASTFFSDHSAVAPPMFIRQPPAIPDASEVMGEPLDTTATMYNGVSPLSQLDTSVIQNAASDLNSLANENLANIGAALNVVENGKTFINTCSDGIRDITETATNFSIPAVGGTPSALITNATNSIKGAADTALKGVTDFASSLDPNNVTNLGSALTLAKFLACPEKFLFAQLGGLLSSIKSKLANLSPARLLQSAMQDFSKIVKGAIDGLGSDITNAIGFVAAATSFLKTKGAKIGDLLSLVEGTLAGHGKTLSFLYDITGLSAITSLFAMSKATTGPSANYAVPGAINGVAFPIAVPAIAASSSCSQAAKIIDAIQGSYRMNNRFDDLPPILQEAYLEDEEIARTIDFILDSPRRYTEYEDEMGVHQLSGYGGETVITALLSTAAENAAVFTSLSYQADNVKEDPSKFEALRINAIQNGEYLRKINNTTYERAIALEEGLTNIERRANFFKL